MRAAGASAGAYVYMLAVQAALETCEPVANPGTVPSVIDVDQMLYNTSYFR